LGAGVRVVEKQGQNRAPFTSEKLAPGLLIARRPGCLRGLRFITIVTHRKRVISLERLIWFRRFGFETESHWQKIAQHWRRDYCDDVESLAPTTRLIRVRCLKSRDR